MNTNILFSSEREDWETPQNLFDELDREYHFTLDAAADANNAKCTNYYTKQDNSLLQKWDGTVWLNPPYGRNIIKWMEKAYKESLEGATVVALLPVRTDTKWFWEYVYGKADIRFIKGRLKFGKSNNPAPFPSMIVIWKGRNTFRDSAGNRMTV